jgi:Zinc knuckle
MDTSVTVRKAMTDAEEQKYRQEGRCFECSEQGHFARNCRKKKTGARATTVQEDTIMSKGQGLTDRAALADCILKLPQRKPL